MSEGYFVIVTLGLLALLFGMFPVRMLWAQWTGLAFAGITAVACFAYIPSVDESTRYIYLIAGIAWLFVAVLTKYTINRQGERIS